MQLKLVGPENFITKCFKTKNCFPFVKQIFHVLLDGITIESGMANGPTPELQTGAGIYNQGKLRCNQVILRANSSPALYNAPSSELISEGLMELRN